MFAGFKGPSGRGSVSMRRMVGGRSLVPMENCSRMLISTSRLR